MAQKKESSRWILLILSTALFIGAYMGTRGAGIYQELLAEGTVFDEKEVFLQYLWLNGLALLLSWGWGYFVPLFLPACIALGAKAYAVTAVGMAALSGFGKRGMYFYLAGVLPHNTLLLFVLCLAFLGSARLPKSMAEAAYKKERMKNGLRLFLFFLVLVAAGIFEAALFDRAVDYLRA